MHTLLLTNFTPPLSQTATNLGPRPRKNVTFSTYKLVIDKYNLNFKLMYRPNHLFILSGVFRGVDMERCPPPSGRRLIFSACNNLFRENRYNGFVAGESSSKGS